MRIVLAPSLVALNVDFPLSLGRFGRCEHEGSAAAAFFASQTPAFLSLCCCI